MTRTTAALVLITAVIGTAAATQGPAAPAATALEPTGGRGLTEVHGIKVGSHTLDERPTGCTVVLVDGEGVPGGVAQRGGSGANLEFDFEFHRQAELILGYPHPHRAAR